MEGCIKDPEVLKFTGSTADFNRDEIIKWYNSRNEQSDRLDLAIVDKLNDVVVGEVVINEYDIKTRGLGKNKEARITFMELILNLRWHLYLNRRIYTGWEENINLAGSSSFKVNYFIYL